MKIIITGAGFGNKGAEAMVRALQTELGNRIPDCEFHLWRPRWEDCRPALNSGFLPFLLPFDREQSFWRWPIGQRFSLQLWSCLELCRTKSPEDVCAILAKGKHRMVKASTHYITRTGVAFDALVDISGFAFGDQLGISKFQRIKPLMAYLEKNARPAVFLPQSWGSFENPRVRQALRRMLGHGNVTFFSRDGRSCRFLEQVLERSNGSIPVTPDIVFGFRGGTAGQGDSVLRSMGCTRNRPIIGVAPNMRVYERVKGRGLGNGYLRALVTLVEHCQRKHDVDIVLQANEIARDNRIDDRYLCSTIAAAVNTPERCFMTREPLTAEATRALVGQFDYIVGSRFHSLVFGLSQGVSGLAIGWSHKYRELFSLFGMEDGVQEHEKIDAGGLIEAFEKGWAERKRRREVILVKAKQLQEEVSNLFDVVAERVLP